MSQAPVMPIYTDAYLADTMHLTCEQHGAYLKLLIVTWRNNGNPLPDDNERLCRILGLTMKRWLKMRPVIEEFFDLSDNTWRQKKLEKVWLEVANRRETNRDNGSRGGRPKSLKENNSTKPNGSVSVAVSETQNEPILIHKPKEEENTSDEVQKKTENPKVKPYPFPKDWRPEERDIAYAKSLGFSDQQISGFLVPDMRQHFTEGRGRNEKRPGWSLTWQRWVRQDIEWHGPPDLRKSAPAATTDRPLTPEEQAIKQRLIRERAEARA